MNTECAYTRRLLPRFLTGHVFGPQRRRIERHLSSCPVCRSEHEALRRIDETRAILRDIGGPAGMSGSMRRWAGRMTRLLYRPFWLASLAAGVVAFSLYVIKPIVHDPDLERLEASAPLAAPAVQPPAAVAAPTATVLPAEPAPAVPSPAIDPLVVTITIDREQERTALLAINDAMKEHALLRTMRFSDSVREISGSLTAAELMTLFNRVQGAGKIAFKRSRLAGVAEGELLPFVIRIKAGAAVPAAATRSGEQPAKAELPGARSADSAGQLEAPPAERPLERSAASGTAAH